MEEHVSISILSLIPFALMLASIAVLPLMFHHFWENNKNKLIISIILSIPIIIYMLSINEGAELYHIIMFDYIPFIILLGSLFVITGGIYLSGDIEATPKTNTIFLLIGAILASFIGTTGAAMLLIRPVIQTIKERKYKEHTILFFIAIVANCGGLLTPLGDPPLFMMYLRGTPFFWFFNLIWFWVITNGILLIIYFLVDLYFYKKEKYADIKRDLINIRPLKLEGKLNFVWLLGIILSVAFLNEQYLEFIKQNANYKFIREIVIVGLSALSLILTPRLLRVSNNFTWEPIKEVAYLFLGIFITMVPCLLYLQMHAKELGVNSAAQFYYYTGFLSAFLDNTPTAVTFYTLASGLGQTSAQMVAGIPVLVMEAICVAAVFFGAMTYIGNGPNFMVKAVAEENNIKMPSFFGYMFKFSIIILLPVYILVELFIL